jgi:hypothetical protein
MAELLPDEQHVCGPWSDCDAACMERSYREYEADEADRCEHGVLPSDRCEDCEAERSPPDHYYAIEASSGG